MFLKPKSKGQYGFTLIELLVVISIIGLLSSVVLASLNSARLKAKDSKKMLELKQLITSLERYYLDTNSLPPNLNAVNGWCIIGVSYSGNVCVGELASAGYFASLPVSPDTNPYYYYDYGTYGLVASRFNPQKYGPGTRGWHCSDATGGASDKWYCLEFTK
jgi:general secretion pathway protein G